MAQLATGGPDAHALVTGPIAGRIPIDTPEHDGAFIDVTPPVLYFDSPEHRDAVAPFIEAEQVVRGIHPVQEACQRLDSADEYPDGVPDAVREQHRAEHAELRARLGGE